jgi:two-component system NtrC family sensor kinase
VSQRPSPFTQRSGTIRLLRLLAGATLLLPLTVFAAGGAIAWQTQKQEAWDKTGRLIDLVYESVSRLFDAHLLALQQAQKLVVGLDDAEVAHRQAELHDQLAAMLIYLPHVRDLFVVSREGRAIVTGMNYPAPTGNDLNDRDYVQYFADGGTGLFVSQPGFRRVDGRRFFVLAIRRTSFDGRYNGVIAASVNPEYFEAFMANAEAAYSDFAGRVMALRRDDGMLLVRSPPSDLPSLPSPDIVARYRQDTLDGGRFEARSSLDGQVHLVAWRRLPQVGMIIVTSITRDAVVQAWIAIMAPYLVFGVVSSLALFGITLLALRRTIQAEAAAALADDERRRRELAEEAARQSQKMEALGKLTGGMAHDFNNLLAVVLGSAELAKTRPPEKVGRLLDNIIHAGQRAASLTRQLLSFARRQPVAPRVLDLRADLPRILDVLRPALGPRVTVETRAADDLGLVEIDPHEWEIALLNIAENAHDAMPDGGTFTVEVANRTVAPGELAAAPWLEGPLVAVTLRDNGTGMPPAVADHAFEPFFTTKEIGRGTGLGLSQVYGFTRQAGGVATLDSTQGQGTTVTLLLPRTAKPVGRSGGPANPLESAVRRVLLVEDDPALAELMSQMLGTMGFAVRVVDRPHEALDWLADPALPVHLLMSEVATADGSDGLELARLLRVRRPALPVLLLGDDARPQPEPAFAVLLRKPFTLDQLAAAVRGALAEFPRIVVDNTRVG